jgi:hypothetical protein
MQVTLGDIHKSMAESQKATHTILADMNTGFRESHHRLAEGQRAIAEAVGGIGHILERMDQRAEERYRDLRGRIGGEV